MYQHMIKKTVKIVLIPALLLIGLSACGYSKTETNQGQGAKTQSQHTNTGTQSLTPKQPNRTLALRATDISDDIPGVARTTAYAYGNDLIVGVQPKQVADVKTVQQRVSKTLQRRIPGYNIHVTTNSQIHDRIQTLAKATTNNNTITPGHPVRDVAKDVGDIIRDIGRTVTAPLR